MLDMAPILSIMLWARVAIQIIMVAPALLPNQGAEEAHITPCSAISHGMVRCRPLKQTVAPWSTLIKTDRFDYLSPLSMDFNVSLGIDQMKTHHDVAEQCLHLMSDSKKKSLLTKNAGNANA